MKWNSLLKTANTGKTRIFKGKFFKYASGNGGICQTEFVFWNPKRIKAETIISNMLSPKAKNFDGESFVGWDKENQKYSRKL